MKQKFSKFWKATHSENLANKDWFRVASVIGYMPPCVRHVMNSNSVSVSPVRSPSEQSCWNILRLEPAAAAAGVVTHAQ